MHQHGRSGRKIVYHSTVADERERDDKQIKMARLCRVEPFIDVFNLVSDERARYGEVLGAQVYQRDSRLRQQPAEYEGRSRKEAAANDSHALDRRKLRKQRLQRPLVPVDYESLKEREAKDHALKRAQVQALKPSQRCGITARTHFRCSLAGQFSPVHSGMCMMLYVIPVVEEQEIIEPAVMAHRPF
jgi:hypothetical protein